MDVGDLGGVAATPDGSRIWIGDSQGGLWLSEDDGASFQRVHPDLGSTPALDVTALSYSHDKLWVGSLLDEHGFTLGVSEDGGETIRRLMVWNDVKQLASCPNDEVSSMCAGTKVWSLWQTDFLVESEMQITPKELGDPPIWPPQGGAPADAGTPAEDDAGAVGAGGAGGTGAGGNGSEGVGTGGSARAPDAGSSSPVGSDGCSCVVAEQPRSAPWSTLGWVLLSMLALACRRKRAR